MRERPVFCIASLRTLPSHSPPNWKKRLRKYLTYSSDFLRRHTLCVIICAAALLFDNFLMLVGGGLGATFTTSTSTSAYSDSDWLLVELADFDATTMGFRCEIRSKLLS